MQNYYKILEVDKDASSEVIEKAYKLLAKKYHPDIQYDGKKKWAEEKLKQINEAYNVLSDKEQRMEYDKKFKIKDTEIYELYNKLLEQNKALKSQLDFLKTKFNTSIPPNFSELNQKINNTSNSRSKYRKY